MKIIRDLETNKLYYFLSSIIIQDYAPCEYIVGDIKRGLISRAPRYFKRYKIYTINQAYNLVLNSQEYKLKI